MRRALADGYVQRGRRVTSDRRVRADPSYACSGRHLRDILVITQTSCIDGGESGLLFVKAWRTEGLDLGQFVSSVDVAT